MTRFVVMIAGALLACCATRAPAPPMALACPLSFDGLVPGSSIERNVVALYGEGAHDPNGGDSGSRSYGGGDGRIVRFVFGVDHLLDRIVVERAAAGSLPSAVPLDSVRFWRRLLPGMTVDEIKRVMGEPQSGDGGEMIYRPDHGSCSSGGFVSFQIERGIVGRIIIAGDNEG